MLPLFPYRGMLRPIIMVLAYAAGAFVLHAANNKPWKRKVLLAEFAVYCFFCDICDVSFPQCGADLFLPPSGVFFGKSRVRSGWQSLGYDSRRLFDSPYYQPPNAGGYHRQHFVVYPHGLSSASAYAAVVASNRSRLRGMQCRDRVRSAVFQARHARR